MPNYVKVFLVGFVCLILAVVLVVVIGSSELNVESKWILSAFILFLSIVANSALTAAANKMAEDD